jgi:hypothetical protein
MNIKNRVDKIETEVNKVILPEKCLRELEDSQDIVKRVKYRLGISESGEKIESPCDICKRQYGKCWRHTEEEILQEKEECKKIRKRIEAMLYNTNT